MKKVITLLQILCTLVLLQTIFIGMSVFGIRFKINKNKMANREEVHQSEGASPLKSMPDLPLTSIEFDKLTYDFGVIKDNEKQYVKFHFRNTGKEPLLIIGAEGSCGCTAPTWPKQQIAPGETESIEIAFDPEGQLGQQTKIVTITSNTEPSTTILTIKATIAKSK